MIRIAEALPRGLATLPRAWSLGRIALTTGVLALLGWALLSVGDVSEALRATAAIWLRPDLLVVFLIGYTAAFGLRAVAWSILLGAAPRPGLPRLFGFLQIALLANHVFPTKVGEVVRVALVARAGTPLALGTSSTVVARLLDLGSLCLLAAVGLAPAGLQSGIHAAALSLPLLVFLAGSALVLITARGAARGATSRLPARMGKPLVALEDALRGLSPPQVVLALVCTLPSWALEALALWTVAQAAGVELALPLAVVATAFTIAFQGFQVTPGGIGLYEASLTAALSLYGVDPATALALALATHALKFAYSFAVGLGAAFVEVWPTHRLRAMTRRVAVVDVLFGLAVLSVLLAGHPPVAVIIGVLATLPLLVAAKCHHLPGELQALLLVPAGIFCLIFGVQSPVTAGADRPLELAVFGLASLLGLVLVRQWWLARASLPAPTSLHGMSLLAVVIPVHDEAATVADVVAGVPRARLAARGLAVHVVVVDDGSTDASARLAQLAGADAIVSHPRRLGVGAALRSGLAAARVAGADAVVYLDGDGEYDPRDMPGVLEPVLSGQADYVLGVRFPAADQCMQRPRRIGNRAFTLLQRLLTGRRLQDGQTGFRAFGPRALAAAEIIHDYNYAQVLTLDLLRKRLRLAEVPIRYRVRRTGRSFVRYHEYALRVLPAMARELLSA